MRRPLFVVALLAAAGACAGGADAPLGYALPSATEVVYTYSDTTLVDVSMMGQAMQIAMLGRAEYGTTFARSADGVSVSLTVRDLEASIGIPMAGTETADESAVRGPLVFTLDPHGRATVSTTPEVSVTASRVISRVATAHTLFPRLPNRPVTAGDQWVDTVSYEGDAEAGAMSETAITRYTVIGETTVEGRSLLEIAMAGTSELSIQSNMGGMAVTQRAEMETGGHVLWDAANGLLFEMVRTSEGTGTASVPVAPLPLPIEVEATQRLRLQGS